MIAGLAGRGVLRPGLGSQRGGTVLPCYYLSFDGGDYASFAGVSAAPPYTVVLWVMRTGGVVAHVALANGANVYYDWVHGTGTLARHEGLAASQAPVPPLNVWQHWGFQVPFGSTLRIFQDGVDTTTAGFNPNPFPRSILWLGAYNATPDYGWVGHIAAVGVAGGIKDIAALWAAGTFHKPLVATAWSTLCLNMRNEGGAGTTVDDESAAGKDATFGGGGAAPAWGGLMSAGGPAGWSDS